MANTLTNLIPTLVQGLDVVSREAVGFLSSVTRDASADRVAKGQTLYSWTAPAASLETITPGAYPPASNDATMGTKSLTISNYKDSSFYFTGEEERALGAAYGNMASDKVEQAIRVLVNQMETDIWTAAYLGGSRSYGTAGTTPFDTTNKLAFTAQIGKILTDNGAPMGTRSLVIDTTAGAALRTLTQLTNVNESGSTMTLRDGELLNVHGFSIKESAAVTTFTAGTLASATSSSAAFTVGQTVIPLATAGTGVCAAGDIISFANDTNKYCVTSVSFAGANPASGDSITLAAPGLRVAQGVATRAITLASTATRNIGFSRNSLLIATRLPAISSGDMASDRQIITDSRSGISFEFAMYPQYRQVRYEVCAAWGTLVVKPEHCATLLG